MAKWLITVGTVTGILVGSISGCQNRNSAQAVPRQSTKQPVFVEVAAETGDSDRSTQINGHDFSFLRPDHFTCFSLNVAQIRLNQTLAGIDWSPLTEPLGPVIGTANAEWDQMERLWLLVDSEFLELAGGFGAQPTTQPWIVIIDYADDFDETALEEAQLNQRPVGSDESTEVTESDEPPPHPFVAVRLGSRRIAIGSERAVGKLQDESKPGARTLEHVRSIDWDADLAGLVIIGPIRTMFRNVLTMARQAVSDPTLLDRLPDDLQRLDFHLRLDDPTQLAEVQLHLAEPETAKLLGQWTNDMIQQASQQSLGNWNFGSRNQFMDSRMTPPATVDAVQNVAREIFADNLFSVRNGADRVSFSLIRPKRLPELVDAILLDRQRQANLVRRIDQLERIGKALEQYVDDQGHLPAPTQSLGENDAAPGFSWRVAILPQLGYQPLYDQFRFDQPWDSPHNRKVAQEIPDEYQNGDAPGWTRWQVYTGPGGLFESPSDASVELDQVTDRRIWTALVIESGPEQAVPWTQPGGIDVKPGKIDSFGRPNEHGILWLNARFDVRAIKRTPPLLKAILTKSGGERLGPRDFIRLR